MNTIDAINQVKEQGYVVLENVLTEENCEIYKSMLNTDYEKYVSKYAKLI